MIRAAIIKAFQKPTAASKVVDEDDEEIIDTTQPGFIEKFTIVNATTPARRG